MSDPRKELRVGTVIELSGLERFEVTKVFKCGIYADLKAVKSNPIIPTYFPEYYSVPLSSNIKIISQPC